MSLSGLKILIGVTGSIAAYKVCDLVRVLQKKGATVRCIITPSGAKIISPYTLQVLTGYPVATNPFDSNSSQLMDHIAEVRWADLYLIAPCTANTIGDIANGVTGSLVSLSSMACTRPQLIIPAMNSAMLNSPAVQRNLTTLKQDGYFISPTGWGDLACGEEGNGKFLEITSIPNYVDLAIHLNILSKKKSSIHKPTLDLSGKKICVALGHTREPIDGVRSIVNTSSGITGLAIAQAFALSGAEVTLIAGGVSHLGNEWGSRLIKVKTTNDFLKALEENPQMWDGIIMSAALADFIPKNPRKTKIKNSKSLSNIELKNAPQVLSKILPRLNPNCFSLGFALENSGNEKDALSKWDQKDSKFLFVNTPIDSKNEIGFGKNKVRAQILGPKKPRTLKSPLPLKGKNELAIEVVEKAFEWFEDQEGQR